MRDSGIYNMFIRVKCHESVINLEIWFYQAPEVTLQYLS